MAANNYGKGIQLAAAFDLGSKVPLDSRTIFANKAEMDKFGGDNAGILYDGMIAVASDTGLAYVWIGDKFTELIGNSFTKLKIDINNESQDIDHPWALTWGNLKALLLAHGIVFTDNQIGVETVQIKNLQDKP